jgi:NTP pyrophosphatase (non-canonical NTP hydrolase)
LLSHYATEIAPTDILEPTDLRAVQHGLFGEVGGIMAAAKKSVREGALFPEYRQAAEEEFGDTLWYLAALCRRCEVDLAYVFERATNDNRYTLAYAASDVTSGPVASIAIPKSSPELDAALVGLGTATARLLQGTPTIDALTDFACHYLDALHAAGLTFAQVVQENLHKACGAFLDPKPEDLIDFDAEFDEDERLPSHFRIRIDQRASGKSYLQWNGVFIGDPLTDNIADPDGYRFHDVFHLANAAVLHWSPVMRALIKHKRKSNSKTDEEQDGGRATVVEEGVTAWLFSRAKALNFYEGKDRVSLGILKTIQEFVTGYEVERCQLKLWESSILQGFAVFRQVQAARGGWIVGDRTTRTLRYEPLGTES